MNHYNIAPVMVGNCEMAQFGTLNRKQSRKDTTIAHIPTYAVCFQYTGTHIS